MLGDLYFHFVCRVCSRYAHKLEQFCRVCISSDHVCVWVCVYVCVNVCVCVCMCVHARMRMCAYVCAYAYVYEYVHDFKVGVDKTLTTLWR